MVLVDVQKDQGISILDALIYLGILFAILACMSAYSRARQILKNTLMRRHTKAQEQN